MMVAPGSMIKWMRGIRSIGLATLNAFHIKNSCNNWHSGPLVSFYLWGVTVRAFVCIFVDALAESSHSAFLDLFSNLLLLTSFCVLSCSRLFSLSSRSVPRSSCFASLLCMFHSSNYLVSIQVGDVLVQSDSFVLSGFELHKSLPLSLVCVVVVDSG